MVDLTQLEPYAMHPAASRWFQPHADLLQALDFGPLNSDRGHDAFFGFAEWRGRCPCARLDTLLRAIIVEFDVDDYRAFDDDEFRATLADDEYDQYQRWYVLDETILASGLAQVALEGGLDVEGRPLLATALDRQRHPLVLGRFFGVSGAAARLGSLRACEQVFGSVDRVPTSADRRQLARAGAAAVVRSVWPTGTLLWAATESGRLLLIQFAPTTHTPLLAVLQWNKGRAPTPAEVAGLGIIGALSPSWSWDVSTDEFEQCGIADVPFDLSGVGCVEVTRSGLPGFLARMALKLQG